MNPCELTVSVTAMANALSLRGLRIEESGSFGRYWSCSEFLLQSIVSS